MGDGFLQSLPGMLAASASQTAADVVIVLPATAGKYWLIPGVLYSYDQLPGVVGGVTISDTVVTLDWDEVANGSFQRVFDPHWRGALGQAVTVTLKSGGAGVKGKLNIITPYLQG